MTFDPVSFSAGIGAGQEAANRATAAAEDNARAIQARAQDQVNKSGDIALMGITAAVGLKVEIEKKWIPYANKLQASIFAVRTEKDHLIAALKTSDPTNAGRIVEESVKIGDEAYARVTQPGSEALQKIHEKTLIGAEESRIDR